MILLLLLSTLFIFFGSAFAATYYVDPVNGDIDNNGSFENPWSTLSEVLEHNKIESRRPQNHPYSAGDPLVPKNPGAPVKAGDTLVLRDGFHGTIFASEYYNSDYITLTAQQGHTPRLGTVELRSGCRWILRGLSISPSHDSSYVPNTLISFSSHGWTGPSYDCRVENCRAFSVWDASGWGIDDWNDLACNGIRLPGENMVARNNHLKNVDFAISVTGGNCLVEGNVVENFSGDGIRGLGDYGTYQYNIVKNCYDVNANHDDGFQSWSVGMDGQVGTGTVYGIIIRGNTIINYEDPNQPFRGTLQGIGCFDGMFQGWVVENNVVCVDHWHGITLSGALDCRIVNNSVMDINAQTPGPSWIRIGDHKNGTPSSGCVIRNNLTTALSIGEGVGEDHNIVVAWQDYQHFFVDTNSFDFHLKPGCAAIDAGIGTLAPAVDKDGCRRPQGSAWDIGAYEFGCTGLIPAVNFLLME
jgi:hypothetical protein